MKNRPNILVVGSINMDMICTSKKLPGNGETVSGMTFSTAAGGKGANQAVQAARLGANVSMVGKVGSDSFGRELVSLLEQSGVDTSHIMQSVETSTGVADIQIEMTDTGAENRILVIPGANGSLSVDDISFLSESIGEYDMVIVQNEIPTEVNLRVAEYAKNCGVPVMLNPAPSKDLPRRLFSYIDIISPNEHEAKDMTGVDASDTNLREKALDALLEMGVKKVIITLGKEGCIYSDRKRVIHSPSVKTEKVLDPTAAGDSFIGAFCTALCYGVETEAALRFANYTASITVSGKGAQPSLPTLEKVLSLMQKRGEDMSKYSMMK